jgi:hypothetical protein
VSSIRHVDGIKRSIFCNERMITCEDCVTSRRRVAQFIRASNNHYPRVEYYTFSTTMKRN